jgi:hypothetical protein
MTEASTTRRPSTPRTRSSISSTAWSSVPIAAGAYGVVKGEGVPADVGTDVGAGPGGGRVVGPSGVGPKSPPGGDLGGEPDALDHRGEVSLFGVLRTPGSSFQRTLCAIRRSPTWSARVRTLVMVAEIAGHRRLDTTRRYSLPSDADKDAALEAVLVEVRYEVSHIAAPGPA